jgi:transposase-like protein
VEHLIANTHFKKKYDTLLQEVKESSYVQVGKKYGGSDNTIRKWVNESGGIGIRYPIMGFVR